DIALTGNPTVTGIPVARIYHGDGTSVTDIHATLLPATHSAAGWGDYDRDGDLDLFAMGWSGSSDVASLYRNDGAAGFHRVGGPFAPAEDGYVVWGDFDNDGDLDLLASGLRVNDGDGLYRNDGPLGFTPLHENFQTAYNSAAWGDYDGDGDLDLLIGAQVCRNDGNGQFVVTSAISIRPPHNAVAWGDFDNDGDLDVLLSGWDSESQSARTWIFRNDGGDKFTDTGASLQGGTHGAVAWIDFDNDGYLDVFMTGGIGPTEYYLTTTHLYRNDHNGHF